VGKTGTVVTGPQSDAEPLPQKVRNFLAAAKATGRAAAGCTVAGGNFPSLTGRPQIESHQAGLLGGVFRTVQKDAGDLFQFRMRQGYQVLFVLMDPCNSNGF
jgi:hypothetical protein